ncbi:MAG: D-glycero-beta-D-manno-heptose-7-phosphate kinase [Verrucomicrobiales bacterium]|nr:D-glycero-beta-D-manno-heptose-7-phosphate kinase [Verrucomicrobiales bacterium]HCU86332.1 D-glycero-beta-D-manno-heptose-7-phosphate kinase [Verrucomicrobiales bacterium]
MSVTVKRVKSLLRAARKSRVLVVGDVMLDQFMWGSVKRISPEAPVPVVEFQNETYMPGGAANVARNLTALGAAVNLYGLVGMDEGAKRLKKLLKEDGVDGKGLVSAGDRMTTRKTRVIAHQQQMLRVDRETNEPMSPRTARRMLSSVEKQLDDSCAVIVCDYSKGAVTQELLDGLREQCQSAGVWLSFDPKPAHNLNLAGMSLITPNRGELFALAGLPDEGTSTSLNAAVKGVQDKCDPDIMLVTLSEQGMLLCPRGERPTLIPTVAQEIYDVSGAGDTVIASFTLAIAAGATPAEAAVFSNHAAGVVVGKMGTAVVTPKELSGSFYA